VDIPQIVESAANKTTYVGGTVAAVGGWTANEIAAFGGLGLAIAGFLLNWYYKHQHLRIAREKARKGEPPAPPVKEAEEE
jgi:hypothetical protein